MSPPAGQKVEPGGGVCVHLVCKFLSLCAKQVLFRAVEEACPCLGKPILFRIPCHRRYPVCCCRALHRGAGAESGLDELLRAVPALRL